MRKWHYGTVYAGTTDKNKGAGTMTTLSAFIQFMGKSDLVSDFTRQDKWLCSLSVVYVVCFSSSVWDLAVLGVFTGLQQITGQGLNTCLFSLQVEVH